MILTLKLKENYEYKEGASSYPVTACLDIDNTYCVYKRINIMTCWLTNENEQVYGFGEIAEILVDDNNFINLSPKKYYFDVDVCDYTSQIISSGDYDYYFRIQVITKEKDGQYEMHNLEDTIKITITG